MSGYEDYDGFGYDDVVPATPIFVPILPPRPEPTKKSWVDRNGRRIALKRMTNSHLCNTIRYLARRFTKMQHEQYTFDQRFAAAGPSKLFPVYAPMVKEARRRGLTP